jgi:hypothetical protein
MSMSTRNPNHIKVVPEVGIEPTRVAPLDFESSASTNFTTPAETFREYSGSA